MPFFHQSYYDSSWSRWKVALRCEDLLAINGDLVLVPSACDKTVQKVELTAKGIGKTMIRKVNA